MLCSNSQLFRRYKKTRVSVKNWAKFTFLHIEGEKTDMPLPSHGMWTFHKLYHVLGNGILNSPNVYFFISNAIMVPN